MSDINNLRMARMIWHDILQSSVVVLSWGVDFNSIKAIEDGTQFHVQGFKIKGQVQIQYVEATDLFKVTIIPDDELKETIVMEDVYVDQLVSLIDEQVEHVVNYEKRICEEYGLSTRVAV